MNRMGVGVLQVWEDGMVTDRDICCRVVAMGKDPRNTAAGDIMTGQMASCFQDQDCVEAAHLMRNKGVRRLTVLSRDQAIVGIISIDDLARFSHALAGEVLEAIAPRPH